MVKNRKWLSVMVVFCMTFLMILSACSSASKDDTKAQTSSSPAASTVTPVATEAQKPVTLKWVLYAVNKTEEFDKVFAEFNKQLQKYLPNTTVEFNVILNTEYQQKWNLIAASGEQVDLAWTGFYIPYGDEVAKGSYLQLDDLLKKYGQDYLKEIPSWVLDLAKVDGKIYSIPSYKDMVDLKLGMRTPKDLADKYLDRTQFENTLTSRPGKALRTEDYKLIEDYMAKLKENNVLNKGISDAVFSAENKGIQLTPNFTIPFDDKTYTVQLTPEIPAMKQYYGVMADWFKKGYIRKDVASNANRRQDESKKDGYSLWFHTNWIGQEQAETVKAGFPVDVVNMDKNFTISVLDSSSSTAIARTSKNPERAMQLIDLMNTKKGKDLYNLLVYGIEGQHYKKVGDNRIEVINGPDNKPKYGLGKFVVGNQFNAWETTADSPGINDWVEKEANGKAIIHPIVGFKPNISNIKNELAQIAAISKEYTVLELGAMENWEQLYNDMITKMRTAGSEKVKAELQKQVDAYLKGKGAK
ncbi:hypothetical protein A8709_05140 [Paenibacillus pectinilyticus]|uniref:DUF3502 domain-containing protein n=1 Tax=Paenibacillus pectinilyticus TaxID=512399 RepID=A0A1C0ZSM6_9BACL|nr:ABC transporter substrate-binding protein [Paenibacillus pectinilyticus]OCT11082.1 hypothetical protein A8709_05140 [Paenibacillus pectinilyticus]